MKYIRTKDGRIIDLKNWSSVETICVNVETDEAKKDICYQRTWFEQHGDTCEYKTEYISHNSQALKEADTIEELCDELVLKDLDTEMCFTMSAVHIQDIRDNWKNLMDNDYLKSHTIYGAIWTDKGLIYVAKMNEKGELKLL